MDTYNTRSTNIQVKSTAAKAGPTKQRGPKQPDERNYALPLLRKGEICKRDFITGTGASAGRIVSQISRLVWQLEKEGFIFIHRKVEGCAFVHFVLVAEPNQAHCPMPAPAKKPPASAVQESLGLEAINTGTHGSFTLYETGATRRGR